MSESLIATAAAAATITVAGVTTGLSYEILMAGFAGSLASVSYLEGMSPWRRLWSVVTSTITAGYTAPVAGVYASGALSIVETATTTMNVFVAFLIGVTAQVLIPAVMRLGPKIVGKYGS